VNGLSRGHVRDRPSELDVEGAVSHGLRRYVVDEEADPPIAAGRVRHRGAQMQISDVLPGEFRKVGMKADWFDLKARSSVTIAVWRDSSASSFF
jgi:hypothetical protein